MKKIEMNENNEKQTFFSHLIELRSRLLKMFFCVLCVFLGLVYFSNKIYLLISKPLIKQLPEGSTMIATDVTSPFLTPLKLTLFVAIIISMPFLLYQFWKFIAPALYEKERKLIFPLISSSTILFYLGMFFAYFVVLPFAFGFFIKTAPDNITISTDITKYLDFVIVLFLAFGLSFEVPIFIVLLCWAGITTPENLKQKRPYAIIITFVVATILTPPDVLSQILLAIPMCILFELGLFFARFYRPKQELVINNEK